MPELIEHWTDAEILAARGAKNAVDPYVPWAFLVEPERSAAGEVVDVATIFLTNRECPFRCLFCDLWKNTTDEPVPLGAIPAQIDHALARLPPARQVKLYNSGNFFDPRAIPREDFSAIAERVLHFENVIVENHPRMCDEGCLEFRDLLGTGFEVALGLETVDRRVLPALNKRMTLRDFDRAADFLQSAGIAVRAFILLKPPLITDEAEAIELALLSIEHAFAAGAECCSVIPTRAGNGIMEQLSARGQFAPPQLASLERVLEEGIRRTGLLTRPTIDSSSEGGVGRPVLKERRVFVDLWDAEKFPGACAACRAARIERLRKMNLSQKVLPPVACPCGGGA
jgi:radical SAM enzyme (TIGR01210 family)